MSSAGEPATQFDVFLSHSSPDKEWVRALKRELEERKLRIFFDDEDLKPGQSWIRVLDEALSRSRFLVLIITRETPARPWVELEWTTFLTAHGPTGRIIPVVLEPAALPPILGRIQQLDASDRDASRVAHALAEIVGRPAELKEGDARRLTIGQELVFELERAATGKIVVKDPWATTREVEIDNRYGVAWLGFHTLTRQAIENDAERAELFGHAATLGDALFGMLFDDAGAVRLRQALVPNGPRPVVLIRSGDDTLLSLPWELIRLDDAFLVRDRAIDLARTTAGDSSREALPQDPDGPFTLVVNVSAPAGSKLSYEAESYRLTRALTELCPLVPTELGTLDDLVDTVARERPTGIHFSGHGGPDRLAFEDDEGQGHLVAGSDLVGRLRDRLPDRTLPPFFYLASCHGNTLGEPETGKPGSESLAARLHRAGVTQVVGYYGPIVDALSTRAEARLYAAIAEGHPTRFAVQLARAALAQPPAAEAAHDTHPFAWSQLVLYQRGPDHPLSRPAPPGWRRRAEEVLHRTYRDAGSRRILATGFIGRRTDLHGIRRRLRQGSRVFVLQGLGGLGKSTLAFHTLPLLDPDRKNHCILWCQDAEQRREGADPIAEALVGQLSEFGRQRFGLDWEGVVPQVDRAAGDDPARRFGLFLNTLLDKVPRLVIYLDNLESLLLGPKDSDPAAFGTWRTQALEAIWSILQRSAEATDTLFVVASCRYINADFGDALIPVNLLPDDAVFRLMEWYPALRRLSLEGRRILVDRLDGHPRAVEFANDLVQDALNRHRRRHGEWRLPDRPTVADVEREYQHLVAAALPQVERKLRDDLLFDAIWDRVLDAPARRMLYRMTLLRRPWEWDLMRALGEPDEPAEAAEATAERLRDTSLLEQVDRRLNGSDGRSALVAHFTLHPATAAFICQRFGDDAPLRRATHRRVGMFLESRVVSPQYIETVMEAGHHLFQACEYDRSCELLGPASEWLCDRGRVREGLDLLESFLAEDVRFAMMPILVGRLLGTLGVAYAALGQTVKAVGFFEQHLATAREVGDRRGEGNALGALGNAYTNLGQTVKAIDFYEQELAIAREVGDRQNAGNSLNNLGVGHKNLGQIEKAVGFYEHALAIAREVGDRRGEARALSNLGSAYERLIQMEKAIGFYEQSLAIARKVNDRGEEGRTLGSLGIVYEKLAQTEKALGLFEQSLAIAREIGDRRGEGEALGHFGVAYRNLGLTEKAIGFYDQTLAIAHEVGDRHGEGRTLIKLGDAHEQLGQTKKAIGLFEQSLAIAREIGDRQAEGNAFGYLGDSYAKSGQMGKAVVLLKQSLQIGQEVKDPRIIQRASERLERLRGGAGS